jgi:transcriptional regulator with XRE-family HTH domain
METQAAKIQCVLDLLGINQTRLATRLDISAGYVSGTMNGKKQFSRKLIKKMIAELQINPDWWSYGTGDILLNSTPTGVVAPKTLPKDTGRTRIVNTLIECFEEETKGLSYEETMAAFVLLVKYLRSLKARGVLKVAYEGNFDEAMYVKADQDFDWREIRGDDYPPVGEWIMTKSVVKSWPDIRSNQLNKHKDGLYYWASG